MSKDIEQFLYMEARLADESQYSEWLALWDDDGVYWVPCNNDDIDPNKHISIIYDNYSRLVERIDRLRSGSVLAQQPKPRIRRIVSNIEILREEGDQVTVGSNFMLGLMRFGQQQIWIGRTIHTLRRSASGLTLSQKKVMLIDNDEPLSVLQFLL